MSKQTEVTKLMQQHQSIRKFSEKKVDEEIITDIITSAQMAATSSHVQAYSIIGVTDQDKLEQFVQLSGGQTKISECSHFLVFCADLYRLEQATKDEGSDISGNLDNTETFIVSTVDATLAAQNGALAAESYGLGICYIGGIRNNPALASAILALPKRVYPIFGLCIGYPAQDPGVKPRLPHEAMYFKNQYPAFEETKPYIDSYNKVVKEYYTERTKGKVTDTWSKKMADTLQGKVREHMKDFLDDQGFPLK